MDTLTTRASSINRALDEIGDRWCLLILQEVFWGINTFNEMLSATGVSRGVLSQRLSWLQSVDCLQKKPDGGGGKRMRYHLTRKSVDLYGCALLAIAWERRFFNTPALDEITLVHAACGQRVEPQMCCRACGIEVLAGQVTYEPASADSYDQRQKKVRRRSSLSPDELPGSRDLYRNLIELVGDRWTANLIALSFRGVTRYDQFHRELPVATNILADRLKFLVERGIYRQSAYRERPRRYEYRLTEKGDALYPCFLALLQWGDKWCRPGGGRRPVRLTHSPCGHYLLGQVVCNACGGVLRAHEVRFEPGPATG